MEKGYYTVENTVDFESICEVLESLPVKTTVTLRTQNAIPYKSVTRKSADRFLGEVVKAVTGQDGIEETVENIVYIDGEEISRETLEATVVQKAVDEVTVIGTKARTVSASVSAQVSQLGLIWPLKRVDNQVISSWWGDDRNHQAIDIASPLGTPIYAAKGGTVTTATRRSDYGNYVVIDHGNGYQTVYAHASKLYVSVGETVMQGQVIAAVGSTGQSSGNHLHFEIRYNGTRIDPAPFLGLY